MEGKRREEGGSGEGPRISRERRGDGGRDGE